MDTQPRVVSLFATTGVRVDVREGPDGGVIFLGSDVSAGLRGYDYEYAVSADKMAALRSALGGAEGSDILALIASAKDEIQEQGEIAWLRARGIEGALSSQMRS